MKKLLVLSVLFLACADSVFAENIPSIPVDKSTNNEISTDKATQTLTDVNFTPYMTKIQKIIKKNWNPPKGNSSKRVVAIFIVYKDGKIADDIRIVQSGGKQMDFCAISAIKASVPLPPLPDAFNGKSVDIQFSFDYNVFARREAHNMQIEERRSVSSEDIKFEGIDMAPYVKHVEMKVKENWIPKNQKSSEKITVSFKIFKDGHVEDISVIKLYDRKMLDEIIKAINASEPFLPLPSEFGGEFVNIKLTFEYNFVQGVQSYNSIGKSTLYDNGGTIEKHSVPINNLQASSPSAAMGLPAPMSPPSPSADFLEKKLENHYKNQIVDCLKKYVPTAYTYAPREMSISIVIRRDGTVKRVTVVSSSGSSSYDNNVVKKITNSRFPTFLDGMRGDDFTLYYKFQKVIKPDIPIVVPIFYKL